MTNTFSKIFNIVFQVIVLLASGVSMFTAYIVFAPDDLPKPFHLIYDTSPAVQGGEVTVQAGEVATPTPAPHQYVPGEGVMVPMSTKIINLVDPGGHKYIRLTVVVEFAPDNPDYQNMAEEEKTTYLTEFQDRINAQMPIMDDTVITLLSTKTYEDLYTADGKEMLRTEILQLLAQRLPEFHILSVYFTEFVVQ